MIGTGELIVIFFVVLLLFGGKRLPELARSLGHAIREFKGACELGAEGDSVSKEPPSKELSDKSESIKHDG